MLPLNVDVANLVLFSLCEVSEYIMLICVSVGRKVKMAVKVTRKVMKEKRAPMKTVIVLFVSYLSLTLSEMRSCDKLQQYGNKKRDIY